MVVALEHRWSGRAEGPVLVLANSLGALQGSWDEVVGLIGSRARVLTFELPGHLRAEQEPFVFDDVVDAFCALLKEQHVHDAVICGVSLGGALAVAAAAAEPDRVGALVTVNAPLRQADPGFWLARADEVEALGLTGLAADLPRRWFTPAADPVSVARLVEDFRTVPPTGYAQVCRAIAHLDLSAAAAAVACPAWCVAGDADVAVSPAEAEAYASVIFGAELVVVPGAPHLLPVQCPTELGAVLDTALQAAAAAHHYTDLEGSSHD